MSRWSKIVSWQLCILISISSLGCATFNSAFGKKMAKATAADPAVEIICLWQPGEGSDPDGIPCKGFMGQIMFLSSKSSAPVAIEGDVRVYLFDDQGTAEEQTKPLRQFDFDSGSWGIHLTSTSYGPTYTVFIPYVRRGVSNAACSLRVRLKPKVGPVIFSEFTNMQLGGPKKISTGEEAKPLSNEEISRDSVDAMVGSLMKTTTIAMGPNPQSMQPGPAAKSVANKEPNPNPIQQASHQVPAVPANDSADVDRIRRLEAMMEKLLEQQNPAPPKPVRTRNPQELMPAEVNPPQNSPETDGKIERISRRLRVRRTDDEAPVRGNATRKTHPLEMDDTPRSHPLEQNDNDEGSSFDETSNSSAESTSLWTSSAERGRPSSR